MPANCSVFGCKSIFKSGGNVQFFGFPLKNKQVMEKWVQALKRINFIPSRASKVCSAHFIKSEDPKISDYLIRPGTYVKHLKSGAVPSLYLTLPTYDQMKSRRQKLINIKSDKPSYNQTASKNFQFAEVKEDTSGKMIPKDSLSDKNNALYISDERIKFEQQLHPELMIKEEILDESVEMEHQQIPINDPLFIKVEDIKIEPDLHTEFTIKDEDFDETEESHICDGQIHTEEEEELFSCDVCDKKFTQKCSIGRHKQTHTGEKPYSCDACSKKFTRKSSLVKHQRIHSGEKPYSCDLCDKRFSQKVSLVQHKRTHIGEKLFSCDVCDKKFIEKSNLIQHQRIHTGVKIFTCDICEKNFNRKHNLIIHRRLHEKLFSCNFCDQIFTEKINLVLHRETHAGEKHFSCDICDKKFTQNNSLTRHKKMLHNVEKSFS